MLKLKKLTLQIGHNTILSDINLNINNQEYFVILGPTGSGKTQLLNCIIGSQKYTGKILLDNVNINKKLTAERNIGIVFQDFALFPHLNVKQNVVFSLKAKGKSKNIIKEKLDWLCGKIDIKNILERHISTLSGGERQKVAIARAILQESNILLLDEPLASIDKPYQREMHAFFKNIQKEFNLTIVHVTHNFDEAIKLADHIAILNKGKIEQVGNAREIFKSPSNSFVARFTQTDNLIPLINSNGKFYLDGVNIPLSLNNFAKKYAILHSENIIISKKKLSSSARFSLEGKILNIIGGVSSSEIVIDVGFELVVKITNYSVTKLKLKLDDNIYITFKESSLIYI